MIILINHISVRNSTGGIVQFVYGDDGLDPTNIEGKGIPVEPERVLRHVISSVPGCGEVSLTKAEINEIISTHYDDYFKYIFPVLSQNLKAFLQDCAEKIDKVDKVNV